jgi:hypothetical protein
MSTDNSESRMIVPEHTGGGAAIALAGLAEQQRAIGEIQAALTVAQARPRDRVKALKLILGDCEDLALAEDAEYVYSKGGQEVRGASIQLVELVAQRWGNIEFGFRELARNRTAAGRAGESSVEAFAWDLETNARRKVVFTVEHRIKAHGQFKTVDDPREVYELMANMAQRRVRTCIEDVIPRQIVDAAVEQCRKTLATKIKVTPETIVALCDAFASKGVTKAQLEQRLQRNLESMQPAQLVSLRRIWASLEEGMSDPQEWFDMPQPAAADSPQGAAAPEAMATAAQRAKDAIRAAGAGSTPSTIAAASPPAAEAQPAPAQAAPPAASPPPAAAPAPEQQPAQPPAQQQPAAASGSQLPLSIAEQIAQAKAEAAARLEQPAAKARSWLDDARDTLDAVESFDDAGEAYNLCFGHAKTSGDQAALKGLFDETMARLRASGGKPKGGGRRPKGDQQRALIK